MMSHSVTQPIWKALTAPISYVARELLGTITQVETKEPVLALTFDDGPHPVYTPRLLDVLDRYQARATFFCVGKFAAKHPEVIRQLVQAGHVVGNHSWDHSSFPLITHRERCDEVRSCEEALGSNGTRLFRPPYGQQNIASRLILRQKGYQVIGWTHSSGDQQFTSPDQILEQVRAAIGPGRIILFHDRLATACAPEYFNRQPTVEAVNRLLAQLNNCYRFITVPELQKYGTLVRQNWYHDATAAWLNEQIEEGNVPSRRYPLFSEDRMDAPYYM